MSTILIADDDPLMIRLLEFNLKRIKCKLIVCREGLGAEQLLKTERPDMAIIDVMLPGKSGLELIQFVRSEPKLASMPLIVVTGHGETQVHEELLAAGANRVFTKPFAPSLLQSAVQELLDQHA
ncbi:response regulator [Cerasicoccus maritimus]|uniref:response regulator n=1 Tax=Cerasicoccus maritimus TaxID=490089 RepID=UPI0028528238|nr:response regulator [Cerasicoccus maritimus]